MTASSATPLQAYVERGSEEAFAQMVTSHVDLVYSAALRVVAGDAQLARDVAQIVFADLARKAGRLPPKVMLAGWLYRHACFTAANAVRTERRRQAREREAVAMQRLNEEGEATWKRLAPVLDEAMNRLSAREREALVLRFFQQKPAWAVGEALGISEEAAQKRVSRGVERLRGLLAKRGVALGASGLVVLLAANATQAAPAELAGTILSTLSAGAALPTAASTAAIKALGMTTLQKAVLATVLVGALGTGLYQGHQLALRAAEAQTLSQEQKALSEQIAQLERRRDQATNLLAAARADNARLKSSQHLTELLRLRGQVGALRQALASTGAGAYPNMAAQLVQDPAMKRIVRDNLRQSVLNYYGGLFKELKLTPEQIDQVARVGADVGLKGAEDLTALTPGTVSQAQLAQMENEIVAEAYRQMEPILGEEGVARLKAIREELPARTTLNLLNSQLLGDHPLSDPQSARLVEVVKAEPFNLTQGIIEGDDMAFWATPQDVEAHLANIEASNARVLQQASSFLSSEQLSALSTVLSNGINLRVVRAAAYLQKH